MICKKCGSEIKVGNIYCSNCGQEVQMVPDFNVMDDDFSVDFSSEVPTTPATKQAVRPNNRNTNFWIVIGVACFCVIALIGFLSQHMMNRKAADTDPNYLKALESMQQGDHEKAINYFQWMVAETGDDTNVYFWIARLYDLDQDYENEIQTLQHILSLDPTNGYACQRLLELYSSQQMYDEIYALQEQITDSNLQELIGTYTVPVPVIDELPENVKPGDTIAITAEPNLNIYYTLDGSSPVTNGKIYYSPIPLSEGDYTLKAVTCNEKGNFSQIVSKDISIDTFYELAMPQVLPKTGSYSSPEKIYIEVPVGCKAYYTWDGSMPSATSSLYTDQGLEMPVGNNVLSVILIDEYGNISPVMRCNYIYMPTPVESEEGEGETQTDDTGETTDDMDSVTIEAETDPTVEIMDE